MPHSPALDSFYHLPHCSLHGRSCQGLACFAARADAPERWAEAHGNTPSLNCLGLCYRAPARFDEDGPVEIGIHASQTVLLKRMVTGGVHQLSAFLANQGGQGWQRAQNLTPEQIQAEVLASGLRGRGGAGFPAGKKWQAVAGQASATRYLVVNGDEGDPGSFSDRLLMEDDPFLLIEGCLIAARAIGAQKGIIYVRKEYPAAVASVRSAIREAEAAGWLNTDGQHPLELAVIEGHGSYLCGEETALLNALEGHRPEPRLRPPYIYQQGLHGHPTLVQNVETLCAVPWILAHGGHRYAALGTHDSPGTKLVSLNSLFVRPGLYEVELGTPLDTIVNQLGGGIRRGALKGIMIGGPLSPVIPARLLHTPFDYPSLQTIGSGVGHGGIIAFADDTRAIDIVAEVFRFAASESCGKCTPCHLGSAELSHAIAAAQQGTPLSRQRWNDLIAALKATSVCGHGRGLADFALGMDQHFHEELAACFA